VIDAPRYNKAAEGRIWLREQLPLALRHAPNAATQGFAGLVATYQALHALKPDGKLGARTFAHISADPCKCHKIIPLRGKGFWIWLESDLHERSLGFIKRNGFGHVLIKVADKDRIYWGAGGDWPDNAVRLEHLDALFAKCAKLGLPAFPWVYAADLDPDDITNAANTEIQADLHATLANRYNAKAIIVNAERGFKSRYILGDKRVERVASDLHIRLYLEHLRTAGVAIGLSSYCFGDEHSTFAWKTAIANADFGMPQSYWSEKVGRTNINRPDPTIALSASTWAAHMEDDARIPLCPSGACYQSRDHHEDDWDSNQHSPMNVGAFLRHQSKMGVPFATLWRYMKPTNQDIGRNRVTSERWGAASKEPWR
jgi:hypothetical protein